MIGNPWGLIAFASVPLILIIHMFRSRFQPKKMAGLFLWTAPAVDPSTGRRLHRLEATRSLIAELILAILLSLLCCDLQLNEAPTADHRILILDSTAAMQARDSDTDTLQATRQRAADLVQDLSSSSRVTVITSGQNPQVICGPAGLTSEALKAIESWLPIRRTHSLDSTLTLALELSGPKGTPHIISDRERGNDQRFVWHALGTPLANAGFLATRRTRGPSDSDRVFARIAAHSTRKMSSVMTVLVEGTVVQTHRLQFGDDGEQRLAFDVDAGDNDIVLRISDDALSIDNLSRLLRPERRILDVVINLQDPDSVDAIQNALDATQSTRVVKQGEPAHIIFTDDEKDLQDRSPNDWVCLFSGGKDTPKEAENWVGPFLMDQSHVLTQGLSLDGVVWGGVLPSMQPDCHPLILAGETVLLGEKQIGDRRNLIFNMRLNSGNLTRSPDWPVLIQNIVSERRRDIEGMERVNLRAGDDARLKLVEGTSVKVIHTRPDGSTQDYAPRRRVRLSALEEVGLHTVQSGDTTYRLSVNFQDPGVTNILGARTNLTDVDSKGTDRRDRVESAIDPRINVPLILGALLAFCVNIYFLSGRSSGGSAS